MSPNHFAEIEAAAPAQGIDEVLVRE